MAVAARTAPTARGAIGAHVPVDMSVTASVVGEAPARLRGAGPALLSVSD